MFNACLDHFCGKGAKNSYQHVKVLSVMAFVLREGSTQSVFSSVKVDQFICRQALPFHQVKQNFLPDLVITEVGSPWHTVLEFGYCCWSEAASALPSVCETPASPCSDMSASRKGDAAPLLHSLWPPPLSALVLPFLLFLVLPVVHVPPLSPAFSPHLFFPLFFSGHFLLPLLIPPPLERDSPPPRSPYCPHCSEAQGPALRCGHTGCVRMRSLVIAGLLRILHQLEMFGQLWE